MRFDRGFHGRIDLSQYCARSEASQTDPARRLVVIIPVLARSKEFFSS